LEIAIYNSLSDTKVSQKAGLKTTGLDDDDEKQKIDDSIPVSPPEARTFSSDYARNDNNDDNTKYDSIYDAIVSKNHILSSPLKSYKLKALEDNDDDYDGRKKPPPPSPSPPSTIGNFLFGKNN
jgi:hypothetical protein